MMSMLEAPSGKSKLKPSPRDIASLNVLAGYGFSLIEVKISRVSAALGQRVCDIQMPIEARLVCLVRNQVPILDVNELILEEGDALYIVTPEPEGVRSILTV